MHEDHFVFRLRLAEGLVHVCDFGVAAKAAVARRAMGWEDGFEIHGGLMSCAGG